MTEESLPSFDRVLAAMLGGARTGKPARIEELKRADRELVEDTLRVMSITFSYTDGPAALDQFVTKQGQAPYSYLLYSRLGDLYVDKQRFQDAATTYRNYVARDPFTDEAPNLAMQAIEAYRKGGFSQLVLDGKHEFVERYNFGTPFWQNRDRAKYSTVVQELKTNLKDVAVYFHATAQKSKKVEDYQEAARWYRDYLKSFPDDPDSAATNYSLAEVLILATYTDPWGLVINEGMACGLPIIVSDVAGCAVDLVTEGWNGKIVPARDAAALAAAMRVMAEDPERRALMALNSSRRISSYSPQLWSGGILEMMQRVRTRRG